MRTNQISTIHRFNNNTMKVPTSTCLGSGVLPRRKPALTRHFAAISAAPITVFWTGLVPMKYFGRFTGLLVALFPLWSSAQTASTNFQLRWVKEQPSVNGVWQIDPRSVAVD